MTAVSATLVSPRFRPAGATVVRSAGATHVHLPARLTQPAPTPATYRRRRVGAAVFVLALVVSVGSVAQRGLADRGGDPASAATVGRTTTYLVQPGDTLWAIAQQLYAGEDISLVVDALVTLNGGATIQPGQLLNLP